MQNLSQESLFLIELAEEASKIMLSYYSPLGFHAERKADSSFVTKVDIEINQMVIEKVKEKYPEYEILGEELSTEVLNSDKLFVVDPLDGTLMFKLGIPLFCFSCAIVINGIPTFGIIANPLAKRTLVAEKNKGAYWIEGNEKIHVNNNNQIKDSITKTGWKDTYMSNQIHKLGGKTLEVHAIAEAGSLVALGALDAAIYTAKHTHDIAAIKILVEEAGGLVTNIYGEDQRYDQKLEGALITNGSLHNDFIRLIRESGLVEVYFNKE